MKKQLLIISSFLLYSLYGCGQGTKVDPFGKINYGIDKTEIIKSKWQQNGILTDPEYDNTMFRFLVKGETKDLPVEVTFNPDGYETDEIRQVELDLNSDEVIEHNGRKFTTRGRKARPIKEVEEILEIYHQYYGKPDSIIIPELSENIKSLNKALGRSTKSQERTYIWKEKNFRISFYIPKPGRIDINASELYYDNAEINYSSLDYEKNLLAIKEKIRQNFTPSDVVEISLQEPNWIPSVHPNATQGVYDFHYDIGMARKIAPEEERAVKAVKFDIVFIDSFQDEVARWEGINFQLPEPLDKYAYLYNNKGYSITYDSREKKALPLEIGRQTHRNGGITIKADVKSILYTNGDLLKN